MGVIMFACLYVPDFPVQAAVLAEPEQSWESLRNSPMVVLDGPANLPRVAALNDPARKLGIEPGMTKLQVETCGGVLLRKRSIEEENSAHARLLECANDFSPKVEPESPGTVLLDLAGTGKLFGSIENTAKKIHARAEERGFRLRVAVASNPETALYAARGFSGITMIPRGQEARRLGPLAVDLLPIMPEMLETLESWGIRSFQALAALPEIPLTERLGQAGLHLQRLARGQIHRTLAPAEAPPNFRESYEFDDPVETLESLAFVLNRLLQQLCAQLVAHALATNELRLRLDLEVRRQDEGEGEQYQHEWKLPVPTQDRRVLLTLLRLDLERSTFAAPIKKVSIEAVSVKPRMAQGHLFAPPSPEAERLEITLARIRGVVGNADEQGISCVGSPRIVDSYMPDAFTVEAFSSVSVCESAGANFSAEMPVIALRIFRPALETTVELTGEAPHFVRLWKKYRRVLAASGPWCSSGNWWNAAAWAREEWDVALKTATGMGFYRIYRDRLREQWFMEGVFD